MAIIKWNDSLEIAKENKKLELSHACNTSITGRFSVNLNGVEYKFSNDMEAQMNFEKYARAFDKGLITEILWTAYDVDGSVVRITLTEEMFNIVYLEHLNHIQRNISKYRDFLMPMVENAKTVEEVNLIQWSMSIPEQETTTEESPKEEVIVVEEAIEEDGESPIQQAQ